MGLSSRRKGGTLAHRKPVVTKKPGCDEKRVTIGRGAPKRNLRDRIVAFLEANAPMEFNPRFIAMKLKASYPAVRQSIQRELENPDSDIVRARRGWYRVAYTVDQLRTLKGEKRVGLHGLHFSGVCHNDPTRLFLVKNAPYRYKNMGIYSLSFHGRPVTIEVYKNSPTVSVWLKASQNPLSLEEFDKFCYFIYGWAEGKYLPEGGWIVKQYGFNLDMYGLDMTKSGYKTLTLSSFRKMWVQVYQKGKDMTRVEVHGVSDQLTEKDLMRVVSTFVGIVEGRQDLPPSLPMDKNDPAFG